MSKMRRTLLRSTNFPDGNSADNSRGWIRPRVLLSIALLALGDTPLQSQQQQGPAISVDVKMVSMLAAVRDKHGHLVNTLNKDDFVVEQDGHPQTITYFAQESNLPLTLGLLVDTSMSQRRVLDQERTASHAFLDHVLREDKDKAFVIHFDHEVELLQDLTSSRQKLEASLDELGAPEFAQTGGGASSGGGSGGGGRGGYGRGGGGTLLYDAVYLASNELMKKQQGRKALIILSDGVDRGSKESLQNSIETAQRADTLVYSILFADKEGYGNNGGYGGGRGGGGGMGGGGRRRYPQESRPDGKKILEQISRETGGRFFEVSKKVPIEQIYADLDEELRNQYGLGYVPDKADITPGYHKIHVTVKPKDLVVQTREGYYAER
ncbi:MAG TPA: VWA domain-containing protein [Candidatus Sulfotelmatobacter sp.]|jgi:VWFA-related protein|nr:VWA domain-containing protein [Candidatus Sulfotelmatobacter sp.]